MVGWRSGSGHHCQCLCDQLLNGVIPFQYEKLKRDRNAVRKRMFEIVNFVNMVRLNFWGGSCGSLAVVASHLRSCFTGLQTTEDLRRSGGFGDLVQW